MVLPAKVDFALAAARSTAQHVRLKSKLFLYWVPCWALLALLNCSIVARACGQSWVAQYKGIVPDGGSSGI